MLKPFVWFPLIVQLFGVFRNGALGQIPMTLPLIDPAFALLLSKTEPLDHTSPVTIVVEVPWNVSELAPEPEQPPGLNVWMAAPLMPRLRATAVAVAPIGMVLLDPRSCMIATGT